MQEGRGRWALWLSIAWVVLPACADEPCAEDQDALRDCGREFRDDICETGEGRCVAACFARASCGELDRADEDDYAPWLSRCLDECVEIFTCDDGETIQSYWLCDGENDCVDGSDENGCDYFECSDGQLIALEDECDEFAQCEDRSDEMRCGYFLCEGDSMTVGDFARCDGAADCADGSDEEECP